MLNCFFKCQVWIRKNQLTKHDEGSCPLLISRWVSCIFACITASVRHFQVRNPDGRVLQAVMEEHNSVFVWQVGETLSIHGVENSDIVSLAISGFPNPWHLKTREFKKKKKKRFLTKKQTSYFCVQCALPLINTGYFLSSILILSLSLGDKVHEYTFCKIRRDKVKRIILWLNELMKLCN